MCEPHCVEAVSVSQQLIFTEWVCVYFISIDRQAGEVNRLSKTQWRRKNFFQVIEKSDKNFFLVKMIEMNNFAENKLLSRH